MTEVTLTLTVEEAVTLRDLFSSIGGPPDSGEKVASEYGTLFGQFSPRYHVLNMNIALEEAGIPHVKLERQYPSGPSTIYYAPIDREEFKKLIETDGRNYLKVI